MLFRSDADLAIVVCARCTYRAERRAQSGIEGGNLRVRPVRTVLIHGLLGSCLLYALAKFNIRPWTLSNKGPKSDGAYKCPVYGSYGLIIELEKKLMST